MEACRLNTFFVLGTAYRRRISVHCDAGWSPRISHILSEEQTSRIRHNSVSVSRRFVAVRVFSGGPLLIGTLDSSEAHHVEQGEDIACLAEVIAQWRNQDG